MKVGDKVEAWVIDREFIQRWVPATVTRNSGLPLNRVEVELNHPLFGVIKKATARNLVRVVL